MRARASKVVAAGRDQETPKTKVFISYSRKNMAFADRLETALKEREFEPLIDRTEIYAFEDWWKRIQALIAQADTVIFVLSPEAVASEVCAKEVAFAASLNKRFAPIVFRRADDKLVPEALARLNFIFFDNEAQFADSFDRLCDALTTDIDWIRKHTEYGEAARHWAAGGRAGGLLLRSPALEEAERWIASRPPSAPAPTEETRTFITESRRGATRRRNILTGSLAAGLIIALGLAGLAYWQRGIAVAEQARAERNFNAAKSTVNAVVFDLAQGLRDIEGMRVETVRRILGRAETAVGQLASRTGNDPEVQHIQAAMFSLFSDTYLNLGATGLAADYARKSTDIIRALLATQPSNTEWQNDLSLSLHRLGTVLMRQGDFAGALAAYREALGVMRALAAKDPGNRKWLHDVAAGLDSVGDVLMDQLDHPGALAAYREALGVLRALAAKDPSSTEWRREVSLMLQKVGRVLVEQGDLAGALAACREGLDIQRALSAEDPSNTEWRRDVSTSLDGIGDVLRAQGDLAGALVAYREGLDILRALVAKDPGNTDWQRDVELSLERIGDVLLAQGDLAGALAAYQETVEIDRKLAAKDPNNTQWQYGLSVTLSKIGDVLRAQGDLAGALAAYREALGILRALAAKDPGNRRWTRNLSVSLNRVGDVLRAQGDLAGALVAYREGLDIRRALAAEDPSNTQLQLDLAVSLGRVGSVLTAQGDRTGALAAYQEAVEINRKLAAQYPDSAERQSDLALSLYKLGTVADPPLARSVLVEALAILEKLEREQKLTDDQKDWPNMVRTALSKLA
jgi:tetratricopeptide (TPR) repeat protein